MWFPTRMTKAKRTRQNSRKAAANAMAADAAYRHILPLNLMAPSRELERLREELIFEDMPNLERRRKELRVKVLEKQLTIPNLDGGKRRTRRRLPKINQPK
jgi:hypothetical protein